MEREKITDRAHGIDVSHYQEEFVLDKTWGQIDFAIAKVGEGYNTPYSSKDLGDPTDFYRIWNEGVAKVPIRGVYFYQRSGYSWEMQARMVLEFLERLDIKPHMIWCDLEKGNNNIDKTILADTLRILDLWSSVAPQYTSGFYANKDIIQNYIIPMGSKYMGLEWIERMKAYPLWYAQYYFTGRSPDKQPLTLSTWGDWDLWQYTDKGDRFEYRDGTKMRHYGSPDLNVYNGSVQEMKNWLKISDKPDVPIEIPDRSKIKRIDVVFNDDTKDSFYGTE